MLLKNPKRLISLIIVLAVLVILAFVYGQVKRETSVPEGRPVVERQALPVNQLPNEFPKDFPLESGAQVVQNDNEIVNGKRQGHRQFASSKTLEENYQLYKDYLQKTAWTIIRDVNGPAYKSLIGRQANQVLSVSIDQNAESGKVVVNAAVEY